MTLTIKRSVLLFAFSLHQAGRPSTPNTPLTQTPSPAGQWQEIDRLVSEQKFEAALQQTEANYMRDQALLSQAEAQLARDAANAEYQQIASERQAPLQAARDSKLHFERMQKEIDKKELLLHCIVHDLKGPLAGMRLGGP